MIKSITVVNYLGEQLELKLASSHEETGIYVSSVTGIGPSKANINTVALASDDGGIFNSARLDVRNIVLTLGFYQSTLIHNSIEDARQLTYKYFPNKRPLTLIFETDNRSLYIDGYVESNEPDIFSKEEKTQISIICPDPKFYDTINRYVDFSSIESMFEFPGSATFPGGEDPNWPSTTGYHHDSLTEDLLELGVLVVNVNRDIPYNGDEEIGVTINIHPISDIRGLEIANVYTREVMTINDDAIEMITGDGISAYDEIIICTTKGKKMAILIRNGLTYNIINALGRDPSWFQLVKGNNVFTFTATTGERELVMTMYYNVAYAGV